MPSFLNLDMTGLRKLSSTMLESRHGLPVLAGILSGFIVCILIATHFVSMIDRPAMDFMVRHSSHPGRADTSVVITAIDQHSLDLLAQQNVRWPWPRDVYAMVLDYLGQSRAKAILFDLDFSAGGAGRRAVGESESDCSLAGAIERNGRVVLASTLIKGTSDGSTGLEGRFTVALSAQNSQGRNYGSIVLPLPEFCAVTRGIGVRNCKVDADGVIRRVPLVLRYGGAFVPQLALAGFAVGNNLSESELASFVESAPMDRRGDYRINWYGKGGPVVSSGTIRSVP